MGSKEKNLSDAEFRKIEEVSALVKNLCDGDLDSSLREADDFLKKYNATNDSGAGGSQKIGVDRTQINKDAFTDDKSAQNEVSQADFFKEMERDAQERAERKARNRKLAEESKKRGNDFFKACNYPKAVECYTEAINISKDFDVLYTNRANCYLKLKDYKNALSDSESALFLSNDSNVKAMHFKGKSLLGMKRYVEATESFKQMERTDSKLSKLAAECISETQAARKADEEEEAALVSFSEGGEDGEGGGLLELMEKLKRRDQPPMYYSGGMRVLADSLQSREACVLFRSKGGFQDLLVDHPVISKCLRQPLSQLQKDRRDLLLSVIEALCRVAEENPENQRRTLDVPGLSARLTECLDLTCRSTRNHLRQQALKLLFILSVNESGRKVVSTALDPVKVVPKLFSCIHQGSGVAAQHAASLLNNMALSERFQAALRSSLDAHLLPSVEKLLSEGCPNIGVLPSCINCVANLCRDTVIRKRLATRPAFLSACAATLERHAAVHEDAAHQDILSAVLAVLTNVTLEKTQALAAVANRLTQASLQVLQEYHSAALRERILALLAHVIPRSDTAAHLLADSQTGVVTLLLKVLEDESHPSLPAALKILTACVECHDQTRYSVGDDMTRLQLLLSLLNCADSQIVGNSALCLAGCIQDTQAAELLTHTDIIRHLLILVREQELRDARVNCAILTGKLAQANPRHRERLQELDGFQILDKVMGANRII